MQIGNKRVKARKSAFVKLVEENKDKTWCICSHDNPDPDSLASAMGMQAVLQFLGIERSLIVYCGEISHPQNRAMVNVLDIRANKWEEVKSDISDPCFVFVDCSFGQRNMSIDVIPAIVVDHHKINTLNKDVLFIHDEVGSCSTLIFDLALSVTKEGVAIEGAPEGEDIPVDKCFKPEDEGIKELATALAIGIKTDTMDFLSDGTTDDDFQAFRLLGQHLSDEKFNRIVSYEYPPYVLDYEQIAWQNKKAEYLPHLITEIGFVDDSKSDCIPAIADKFMRIQGVQTVVVYGIVGSSIRASVRTSSAALDCKALCDDIFGKGNGGAKHGVGGATVPFNVFDPSNMQGDDKEILRRLVKSQIEGKFLQATTK